MGGAQDARSLATVHDVSHRFSRAFHGWRAINRRQGGRNRTRRTQPLHRGEGPSISPTDSWPKGVSATGTARHRRCKPGLPHERERTHRAGRQEQPIGAMNHDGCGTTPRLARRKSQSGTRTFGTGEARDSGPVAHDGAGRLQQTTTTGDPRLNTRPTERKHLIDLTSHIPPPPLPETTDQHPPPPREVVNGSATPIPMKIPNKDFPSSCRPLPSTRGSGHFYF